MAEKTKKTRNRYPRLRAEGIATLTVYVTDAERQAIRQASAKAGHLSTTAWARLVLAKAAREELGKS